MPPAAPPIGRRSGAAIDQDGNGTHLALAFARAAAKVADSPWLSATGADFIYDKTQGRRPLGAGLVNRYLERVTRAAAVDEEVNAAFTDVQQLLASPQTLFRPHVAARALRHGAPAHPANHDRPHSPSRHEHSMSQAASTGVRGG